MEKAIFEAYAKEFLVKSFHPGLFISNLLR